MAAVSDEAKLTAKPRSPDHWPIGSRLSQAFEAELQNSGPIETFDFTHSAVGIVDPLAGITSIHDQVGTGVVQVERRVLDWSGLLAMAFPTLTVKLNGTDISAYATQTLSVTRGRSRETDQYQAGTAAVILRNETRRFDPTNTAGPYYPQPLPRASLTVSIAGNLIFSGYVDDIAPDYVIPNISTVALTGLDGFNVLATSLLVGYNAVQEYSGQRIADTVTQVSYPGATALDTGQSILQASVQDQVYALSHMQTAAASENGLLYVDRSGTLTFQDRLFINQQAATYPNGQLTFSDTGSGPSSPVLGYTGITMASATTLLFNYVSGQRSGGDTQAASDATSITNYLTRALSLPTLENLYDADVLGICQWMVFRYKNPEIRFDTLKIELTSLSGTNQAILSALDIGSVVMVIRTPPGGGSAIQQLSMIEHMDWSADASQPTCTLTLGLQDIAASTYFTLNSATNGKLNSATPIFY